MAWGNDERSQWAVREANANAKLQDEIAALKSQLAEAQKDRDRLDWLDWLEKHDMATLTWSGGTYKCLEVWEGTFDKATIREAIDVAMEARNGK